MDNYLIEGAVPLCGEYRVKGAKNAALPIMAATVCRGGIYELHDCPAIDDVTAMEKILKFLGARTKRQGSCLVIDSRSLSYNALSEELMSGMRSSVFLLGSLLTRFGEASISGPGGCRIGKRPVDIHINGLKSLGFELENEDERYRCRGRASGGELTLPYPSVGATENLIMAALGGTADTLIRNCAREPEIVDFVAFLNACGYEVCGAGSDTIAVKGTCCKHRADVEYFIMEDRIEAATYMAAVLGTGGRAVFRNIRAELLKPVLEIFLRMGAGLRTFDDAIELSAPRRLKSPGMIVTQPYPGFPTDFQPQLMTLVTAAEGRTMIREEIFENRFTHKKELVKMGANIEICGKNAIIKGKTPLRGVEMEALDLRGGAALVTAALMAEGRSKVNNIRHISRGYEDFDKGIRSLGGRIERGKTEKTEEAYESIP